MDIHRSFFISATQQLMSSIHLAAVLINTTLPRFVSSTQVPDNQFFM